MLFSVDLEVTNRCNAKCHFCPRDATPHQGMMSPETVAQSLVRVREYHEHAARAFAPTPVDCSISLCGLGEPLLNKHLPDYIRAVREAGFRCTISSNAALLDERRARAVLDAGLQAIYINVGDIDGSYEDVYKLPFPKTRDNIVRFVELAGDRCEVCIVLVDYKEDPEHVAAMREYWGAYGISTFQEFEIMNRGGSLFVDHMQYESFPEQAAAQRLLRDGDATPLCGAPFAYLFVGYDSNYYLCCSDWEKKAPVGSIFDDSFMDVAGAKLRHIADRQTVCRSCNLDPINKLTEVLQAEAAGTMTRAEVDAMVTSLRDGSQAIHDALEKLQPGVTSVLDEVTPRRRLIPVVSD